MGISLCPVPPGSGVLMFASAFGALVGNKWARLGLVVAIGLWVGASVLYETYAYVYEIVAKEKPGELSSLSFWLHILPRPIGWALWLAFNGWYLFRRQATWFNRGSFADASQASRD